MVTPSRTLARGGHSRQTPAPMLPIYPALATEHSKMEHRLGRIGDFFRGSSANNLPTTCKNSLPMNDHAHIILTLLGQSTNRSYRIHAPHKRRRMMQLTFYCLQLVFICMLRKADVKNHRYFCPLIILYSLPLLL